MIELIFVIAANVILGALYVLGVLFFIVAALGIMAFIEGLE